MHLQFLGAAATVTGSQFLLTTARARILIDCGMFQGRPDETMRNRVPLAYDPAEIDALLLTHAHLDHCGLIPHVVKEGFRGPIYATAGTIELAALVLLDSGKLQEEFVKREMRWEQRHPGQAADEDRRDRVVYEAALDLAEAGDALAESPAMRPPGSMATGEHVPTMIEPNGVNHPGGGSSAATSIVADSEDAIPAGVSGTPAALGAEPVLGADDPAAAASVPVVPPVGPVGAAMPAGVAAMPTSVGATATAAASGATVPATATAAATDADVDLDEPLYTELDARASLTHFRPILYGQEFQVAPGILATFVDAGHILGSAIIRLRVTDHDGGPERHLVFSGDLGRPGSPILRDYTSVTDADYLLIESTYGGREHEPEAESTRIMAETIRLVAESDGVLLVPSFAIGRTQEIVWQLDRLIDSGEIPQLPLYLDSPMASKATDIYRRHPEYYDAETMSLEQAGETPLDYPGQIVTNDFHKSQAIEKAKRPYMIVASNGMLTGGRVVGHLRNLIDDPLAVILFVGYQGEGTLGAHLQAGAATVRIEGQTRTVRCKVRSISGFSAHADESELLDWIGNFSKGRQPGDPGMPKRVFIVHGDPDAQVALEPKLQALGFTTHIPKWHERVTLD